MGRQPLLICVICILITHIYAYTYTAGTFPTVLPCTWQCLTGSPTGSCFCVVNMNITAKWSEAQSVCTADGGYLAKILNADEQMLMEELTLRYAWNVYGTNTTLYSKNLYIGLQRNYYYSGTSQPIFKWRDTCLEPKTDDPTISQIYNGYTTTLWTNIPTSKPNFPIGCCNDGGQLGQFWFSTEINLGPWQDYPYELNYIGRYIGAYCRKDRNICGSNPCKNGGVCVDTGNSCLTCTCAAGFTGTVCEYSVVTSSLPCDWTCMTDAVTSCICVIRNDTDTLKWSDAKAICEADGAYLARIDTKEINDVIDNEVRLKLPNFNYGGTGSFNLNYHQTAAIGLQKVCNGTSGTFNYKWRDNCLEKSVYNESDFKNVLVGSTLYPTGRFTSTTRLPIGGAQGGCDNQIYYYSTYDVWGPWDDFTCCGIFWQPGYMGIACRKDLNPCGSNPCLATEDCVANKSCFNCVPKTTSTTTTTTTATTTTTTTPAITTTTTAAPGATTIATTVTTSFTSTAAATNVAGATVTTTAAPSTTTVIPAITATTTKTTTTTTKAITNMPTTSPTTTTVLMTAAAATTVAPNIAPIVQQAPQIFCPFINSNYPNLIATSNKLMLTNNNYPTGTLLTFKCDKGYNLVGVYSIKCNPTGMWSDIPPQCIKPQWKWWWWPWLLAMLLALAACLFCILYYLLFKRAKDRQRQQQYPMQHWAPPRIAG